MARHHTAKTVDELLAQARATLPHRPSPAQALHAQASGALLIDIREDDQRREDGLIPGAEFTDITTRDLNNDGRLDLIASSGSFDFHFPYTTPGAVHVLLGNGNGTFQPPIRHETGVLGSMSVVVGDFTRRDRSAIYGGFHLYVKQA